MVGGKASDTSAWWAVADEASRNWASSSWFIDYAEAIGRIKICLPEDLDLGDIVSINRYGGRIKHLMIITGKRCGEGGDELLYSAHTENRMNYPLANAKSYDHSLLHWKVANYF
jgi:hypothetical protein